ncbi:Lipopolysaccharide assembly protein B [Castellaniella denitrificans]
MLRARWAALRGDLESQRAQLQDVLSTAPEFSGLVAQPLLDCYAAQGRAAEGLSLLRAQHDQLPTLDLFNVIFRALRAAEGAAPAWAFARQALRAHPSLLDWTACSKSNSPRAPRRPRRTAGAGGRSGPAAQHDP